MGHSCEASLSGCSLLGQSGGLYLFGVFERIQDSHLGELFGVVERILDLTRRSNRSLGGCSLQTHSGELCLIGV